MPENVVCKQKKLFNKTSKVALVDLELKINLQISKPDTCLVTKVAPQTLSQKYFLPTKSNCFCDFFEIHKKRK